jgi:hypothetical protein
MRLTIGLDMTIGDIKYAQSRIRCLSAAALIYLHIVFCSTPIQSRIIGVMVERLQVFLFKHPMGIISDDGDAKSEVFWMLTVGRIAAAGRKERPWFVERWSEISVDADLVKQRQELYKLALYSGLDTYQVS